MPVVYILEFELKLSVVVSLILTEVNFDYLIIYNFSICCMPVVHMCVSKAKKNNKMCEKNHPGLCFLVLKSPSCARKYSQTLTYTANAL